MATTTPSDDDDLAAAWRPVRVGARFRIVHKSGAVIEGAFPTFELPSCDEIRDTLRLDDEPPR